MTEDSNALPAGFSLQRYLIESVLGAGGFGITYQAIHEALENRVALKEYFPAEWAYRDHDAITVRANAQGQIPARSGEPACYDWGLQRFLDEARILAQINHPHVVRVRDYFTANGSAYIVMEYEAGESLSAMLQRGGILPESELHRLLRDVLPALEAVHGQGYLHRDLKPSNLYIRSANGHFVLIDFGAARQALGRRTRSVTSVVTPGYSPIEQYVTVGEDYGPWTDIYALGAVLYRCITGAPPIEAPGRVLKDPVQPAIECGAGLYSPGLLRVIDRALSVRPEERFQTVAAMRDALQLANQINDPANRPAPLQVPQLRPELLDLPPLTDPLLADNPHRSKPSQIISKNTSWADNQGYPNSQPQRLDEPRFPPVAPSPQQAGKTLAGPAAPLSSDWSLDDFDNLDNEPVDLPKEPSSPQERGPSRPWFNSALGNPSNNTEASSSAVDPSIGDSAIQQQPDQASGFTILNRPPRSAVEHLRQASLYKTGSPPSDGPFSPNYSTPLSKPIGPLENPEPKSSSIAVPPAIIEPEAIIHGQSKTIDWKWIAMTVCAICGLSGTALFGYEYAKAMRENQRWAAAHKQQNEAENTQRAQEDAQRQEAEVADRAQQFRNHLASGNLVAAELVLKQVTADYPSHPLLATLNAEFRTAERTEQQGVSTKTWLDEKTGIKFIMINGGCFNMGSPPNEQDRGSDETSHGVCVRNFWISATEITNQQYRRFKSEHNSGVFQGRTLAGDTQPVVNVAWDNVKAFTEWLSWEVGSNKRFRLPTEAEWEYAARAKTTTRYFWGNEIDPRYANFSDRNDPSGASVRSLNDNQAVTAPVGSYLANPFGLADMAGNVWEWTCSYYDRNYSGLEQSCTNQPNNSDLRVVRGGSWNNGPGDLRSAKRLARKPDHRDAMTGFRVVMEE